MSRHHWFDHHPPCPGGCNNLADECTCARPNPLGSMQITEHIGSSRRVALADLYDGDNARRDPVVARLRGEVTIPHPLHEVLYADGFVPDTTAGRVRSHGRRVPR